LQELIQQVPHRSVLEVGCAEGALTAWLTTVAEQVVALDISATACERTRTRAPKAIVLVANVGSYTPEIVFDLVVCAETLYYMRYPAAVLAQLHALGAAVLLTYTRHERTRLDPIVAGFPPARLDETFVYTVRTFPPKKRGCRCLLWGPGDAKPRVDAK
jgi:2-polyprenyl-3-methyl-5-hydroxy-6-metoxy-1,4-benzoquinol methylase